MHQAVRQQELHLQHVRQTDQVLVVNQQAFLHLHGNQTIILNNPGLAQTEHLAIVVVELPEAGLVIVEAGVPEAEAEAEGEEDDHTILSPLENVN